PGEQPPPKGSQPPPPKKRTDPYHSHPEKRKGVEQVRFRREQQSLYREKVLRKGPSVSTQGAKPTAKSTPAGIERIRTKLSPQISALESMSGSGRATLRFAKWTARLSKFMKGLAVASELATPLTGYVLYQQEKSIHEKRIFETILAEIKIKGLEEVKFFNLFINPSTGDLYQITEDPLVLEKINIPLSNLPGHEGLYFSKEHKIMFFKPEFETKNWRMMDFPND
ncbi:MAG: hypothetical protein ABFS32_13280, partial [Bacteroidota bacterium]